MKMDSKSLSQKEIAEFLIAEYNFEKMELKPTPIGARITVKHPGGVDAAIGKFRICFVLTETELDPNGQHFYKNNPRCFDTEQLREIKKFLNLVLGEKRSAAR